METYEENKKIKEVAKIKLSATIALCAKTAQGYLCKLRLAPFIERRVLHCAASKTTLIWMNLFGRIDATMRQNPIIVLIPDRICWACAFFR